MSLSKKVETTISKKKKKYWNRAIDPLTFPQLRSAMPRSYPTSLLALKMDFQGQISSGRHCDVKGKKGPIRSSQPQIETTSIFVRASKWRMMWKISDSSSPKRCLQTIEGMWPLICWAAPVAFLVLAIHAHLRAVVRMVVIKAVATFPEGDWVGVCIFGPIRVGATSALQMGGR